MTQESSVGTMADTYAAEAYKEGVLKGRQDALIVLAMMGTEADGFQVVDLTFVSEFSIRLWERPFPPFRHGTGS